MLVVFKPKLGVARNKAQKGLPDLLEQPGLHIGYDVDLLDRVLAQLRNRIERTDAVDLVAEKLDAKRQVVGIGEYIHNTPPNRKLARFIYKIGLFKVVGLQQLSQKFHVQVFTHLGREGIAAE